ncbi:MAG: alkaline phosphatase D family protein [Candidatus Solibacter usitatus]|nr:alkaline phosphatase D family protein [Candidatus Solibacter usitatus]
MTRVSRRTFVATAAAAAAHAADSTRPWLGPDYWANPMQDWCLRNSRIECIGSGGERNVFLLTRDVSNRPGAFTMSIRLGRTDSASPDRGWVGFRTGIRGHFQDYRDSAVHGEGFPSGILADGRLFIGEVKPGAARVALNQPMRLALRVNGAFQLTLEAQDDAGKKLAEVSADGVDAQFVEGGVAIVCSAAPPDPPSKRLTPPGPGGQNRRNEQRGGNMRFWFSDWQVSGEKIDVHADRAFGPICFAMHTLSRGVMKMTAQLAPLEPGDHKVQLQTKTGAAWRTIATAPADPMSRTAAFRIAKWDDRRDTAYRLVFGDQKYEGTVRKDPKAKDRITIGALTCTNDLGFPHNDVVANLRHFRPDILLFTGDQIYERVGGYGIQMEPLDMAAIDYLRKWYLFGWSFRELTRDTPIVCLPDDHDVYHGNVWGAGGKKAVVDPADPESAVNRTKSWQDSGGYKMPGEWVNMVQRTQTSHLPDPFDATPVEQGISVYYTSLLYGGVSFAIVEDRKWKSSPRKAIPWADIQNGWAQNPKYDAPQHGSVPGAELLGPRQLAFLEKWAQDWDGAFVKAVVSQTILTNLATLPPPANNDDVTPRLPILRPDAHPPGELCTADHDSNGWPQGPRTLALRTMRKASAFHIGGDQHLGSTTQYGIDDWNDGPYALCTPAVANIFPRHWYPPVEGKNRAAGQPRYCGEFTEGFGNRITVHAIANPGLYGAEPAALHNRAPGYGIVHVDKTTRKITMTNWPRWVDASKPDAKPYKGWPITIHQFDNGINTAKYSLPTVTTKQANAVVQVVDESNGDVVYTVRIQGRTFTPRVFRAGVYTVRVQSRKGVEQEHKRVASLKP